MKTGDIQFNSTPKKFNVDPNYINFLKNSKPKNKCRTSSGKYVDLEYLKRNPRLAISSKNGNKINDQKKYVDTPRKFFGDRCRENKENIDNKCKVGSIFPLGFDSPESKSKIEKIPPRDLQANNFFGNDIGKRSRKGNTDVNCVSNANGCDAGSSPSRSVLGDVNPIHCMRYQEIRNSPSYKTQQFPAPVPQFFANPKNYYERDLFYPTPKNLSPISINHDSYEAARPIRQQPAFNQFQNRVLRERDILYRKKAAIRQIALNSMRLAQQRKLRGDDYECNLIDKMNGLNVSSEKSVPNFCADRHEMKYEQQEIGTPEIYSPVSPRSPSSTAVLLFTPKELEKLQRDKASKVARIKEYVAEYKRAKEYELRQSAMREKILKKSTPESIKAKTLSMMVKPKLSYIVEDVEQSEITPVKKRSASEVKKNYHYGIDELKSMNPYCFLYN